MVPLLIWDSVLWSSIISKKLQEEGLCGLCIVAYLINFYFFAGFCEEFVKYLVVLRISTSRLSEDWRAMMAYGIAAGCGFATAENLLYVLSSG
jgi:RsiW-degrading membrane proteinase PrsW (M82 family)